MRVMSRMTLFSSVFACTLLFMGSVYAENGASGEAIAVECRFGGEIGARTEALVEHWILPAWEANPMMTEMFRLRDRKPPYEFPVP